MILVQINMFHVSFHPIICISDIKHTAREDELNNELNLGINRLILITSLSRTP